MLQIGDITVHLISDGDIRMDGGGAFGLVPKLLWKTLITADEDNLIPMRLTCLLVQTAGRNIVVDTGLGDKLSDKDRAIWWLERPRGGLVDGLARLGLAPGDIDLVIDTHLHSDHAGGNTRLNAEGAGVPTFPNAEYVVQRREFEDATHPNERTRATYQPVNYQPLADSGQLRLLDGDTDLAAGLRVVSTPGHTPGHMSVLIESEGERALFVCDLSSFSFHFERLGWMTSWDVEPLVTLETKRRWQAWALETGATLIFPHDPFRPVGRLVQEGQNRPKLIPIDVTYA